ncbi:MAG: protein-disulfide reductase DsbD family protein [Planctomycetota bacterium]|nr:protein-disulfide reductase DsbD family protein [Planctomycetota bacterium]
MTLLPLLHALLLLSAPAVAPQDDDELPDGNKLVQVSMLADHEAVKPGGTATLAVRYAIEPKWHIYWENPGDSGLPTRAKFTAPAGWKVAEPRFPSPERHEDPGDITTFIFEKELVLLAEVTVPADAKPGSKIAIEVEAGWLVCTEICVPGSGKATVELTVADAEKPANEAVFRAARANLPKAWSELAKARANWSGTEAEPRLTLVVPGAKSLEYFPLDVEPVKLASRTVDAGKNGATLRATFAFERKAPEDKPRIRGVLRVHTESGDASYLLDHTYTPPPAGQ